MVRAVASAAFDFIFRYLHSRALRFYDRYRLTYGHGPRETVACGRSRIERSRNCESFFEMNVQRQPDFESQTFSAAKRKSQD